jgi:hypothetical protein
MAISLIDEALYTKIQNWIKDPNLVILKPNETLRLFQTVSDQTGDKPIKLPLIALSRDSDIEVLQTNKKPLSFSGKIVDANSEKTQILNGIPIEVSYQLDIYTKTYEEGDQYLRNFIFNFVNHPKLVINIPYNKLDFQHNANVRISPIVTDTSDIPQRLFPGQFTRWTIKLNVDDCYLFSVPVNDTAFIEIDTIEVIGPEKEVENFEGIQLEEIEETTG